MPERMTVSEVAEYLRVSTTTVQKMCAMDGGIPHLRAGIGTRAKIIIDKIDLDGWIERNKVNKEVVSK